MPHSRKEIYYADWRMNYADLHLRGADEKIRGVKMENEE
jgi:hypothetical protein